MIDGTPQEVTTTRYIPRRQYIQRHKIVLPADVAFEAGLETEIRYRSIHRLTVYTAPVAVQGSFLLPDASAFEPKLNRIYWDKAWLAVGITDPKGIAETAPLMWEGAPIPEYRPGTGVERILGPGFHALVPLTDKAAKTKQNFSIRLKMRGSSGISFTSVGEHTAISVSSAWPDPSFCGELLPVERHIDSEGFTAQWSISNLTRGYPQIGDLQGEDYPALHNESPLLAFTAGVALQETVSLYRMIMRAMHYAILFIAATFTVLFAFEMAIRRRMNLLQYVMVGLSLSLFYLVLLSLAEHVDFRWAFTAAAAITVIMNSLYVAAVLSSKTRGLLMAALLAALYSLLFSLLHMEDFALLGGTALVVAIMGVLMFFTRRLPQAPAGQ
jgi:inner membrane protein